MVHINLHHENKVAMHEHSHPPPAMKYLGIALGITITFFIIELVGGILTGSLALLTDAWHMLNDVFALSFSLIAARLVLRSITAKRTYGYHRAEVLAAFVNGVFLWAIVVFIFYEAFQRLQQPVEVRSLEMLIIAVFGLMANGLSALVLSRSRDDSLNIRGAFLHVVADALGSVGAISAGVIMYLTGWYQADALVSMAIGVLIFYSSAKLIRDSLNVLLEAVPSHIDLDVLERKMLDLEDVDAIHDLHVWCITPTRICMSAHVVTTKGADRKMLISTLITKLKEEFGIDHTTIQLEEEEYPKAAGEH